MNLISDEVNSGWATGDDTARAAADNWFTVTTLPYIPPSRLSDYDARYDQGLTQLVYLQTLIVEEIEC